MNNKSKEFNITRAVRLEFEENKNTDNLKDILCALDYSEVSRKQYIIYFKEPGEANSKQYFMDKEETLAQNFMDCLPFEAYQPYINKSWLKIQFKEDYPLVRASLYSGNFKMLSLLGDLGFESCFSNKKDSDFHSYKRLYLNKILEIDQIVGNGRDKDKAFFDGYYKVFKKGLVQYKAVMEDEHKKMNYNQEVIIDSWLFSLDNYSDGYSKKNNIEKIKDFLHSLASKPQAEKITDDVMEQIKKAQVGNIVVLVNGKKKKQQIDILSIVENSEIIESAIWANNQDFINKLQSALNIPNSLIMDKIVSCFEKTIDESPKEVYKCEKYLQLFNNNCIGEFILSQTEGDSTIKNLHHLGLLVLCEKEQILNYVKENINLDNSFLKIRNTTISYKDSISISYIMKFYMEENFPNQSIMKKPLFLEVGEKLIQLGYKPKLESWSSLSEMIKEEIIPIIQDFYYKDKNKRLDLPNGLNEWLNQFYLSETLKELPSKSSPKVKI